MRWSLMDRYLAGECGPAEKAEVEEWIAQRPTRRQILKLLAGPGEAELREARATIWAGLADRFGADDVPH